MSFDLEYLTSERFIHDDLLRKAEELLVPIWDFWKKTERLPAIAVSWPAETITDDSGIPMNDRIVLRVETSTIDPAVLKKFVTRTRSYALLTVEDAPSGMTALFESPHGTRRWQRRALRLGDTARLGPLVVEDNVPAHGLLTKIGS